MARYTLPNYQSVYRDPQSVGINEELRKRFIDSFGADDELAAAVDGMQSADFEGDLNKKNQLAEQYNLKLDDRAARGDYETMGMNIARDARSFVKDYTPIKSNKERYDAWTAQIKELEELGDEKGGITSRTSQLMKQYAKHNYKGLQYDEFGNLVEDSYFSSPKVVKDVNLEKRMQEEMKDVVERSSKVDIQRPLGPDGKVEVKKNQDANGDFIWFQRTVNGWEAIPDHVVNEATNRVLKHDDVQASLNQKAMLENFPLDEINPQTGEMQVTSALDNFVNNLEETKAELNGKAKLTEEEQKKLNNIQDSLNYISDNREEVGDMRTWNQVTKSKIENDFANSNLRKYSYINREYKEEYSVNELYKMSLKKTLDDYQETISIVAETQQVNPLGGLDNKSKLEYIQTSDNLMTSELQSLKKGFLEANPNEDISLNDILLDINNIEDFSTESIKDLASKYNLHPDTFKQQALGFMLVQQKRDLVKQKLRQTEQAIFGDDYNQVISNEYANKMYTNKDDDTSYAVTGQDILDSLVNAGYLDENSSVKDAIDMVLNADKQITGGSAYGGVVSQSELNTIITGTLKNKYADKGVSTSPAYAGQDIRQLNLNIALQGLLKDYEKAQRKNNEILDKEYNKTIKTDLGWSMNWFGNKENTAKVQKAFEDKFSDNAWASQLKVLCHTCHKKHGKTEPVLATTLFDKMDKMNVDNVKVSSKNVGLLSVSRADGTSMLVIPIVDEAGRSHTLYAPIEMDGTRQIRSESLDSWINSAEFQITKMWQDGVQANIPADKNGDKLFKPSILNKTNDVTFNYGDPTRSIQINGVWMDRPTGLAKLAELLHTMDIAKLHGGKQSVDKEAFEWTKQ